jgi:hypothetical protein
LPSEPQFPEKLMGFLTCRKAGTWDILFYFPSEGRHTEDFLDARKIQRLRPGLNPRTRVPVASMLTTRPTKSSQMYVTIITNFLNSSSELSVNFITIFLSYVHSTLACHSPSSVSNLTLFVCTISFSRFQQYIKLYF